ncbi:MAG: hypothetical protein LC793_05785 [Thermomicrobia bacterium]|nr:hypothetical protein [Thermomicrobia bacterium]MCA1722768.1 hypothetical protein [Thermomicrobia bacterium]
MSAPRVSKHEVAVPAVAVAATADTPIVESPFAGTVTAVSYVADATITGAATNNRTVTLYNRGQAGAGTTVVAQLNFAAGTNAAQYARTTIPLSTVAGATTVAANDVLEWDSAAVGTGISDGGGLVHCELTRGDVST